VLIPAVENSISGTAYRPLDVIKTRKGITVEVGNTDAEGRLILCDALVEADSEKPDLLIDFATLTGAARVALGTELPALFCNDDALANAILDAGLATIDPLWRLPLFHSYRRQLDSKIADINNISSAPTGGAITAALFLNEFVSRKTPWAHIDTMAYNMAARPGRPAGGEVFGLRAMFEMLRRRYG
jgi:leucyl aminopeptidase